MNGLVRFTFTLLLIGILAGCAAPTQILPTPTATLPSPTATLPLPTPMPKPTRTQFVNPLIYDIPEMYQVNIETVQYHTLNDPSLTLPMDIYYPPNRQADQPLPAVILPNTWQRSGKWYLENEHELLVLFEGWGRIIAANGLIAVTYDTLYPNDLEAVVRHIQQNSTEYGIDGNQLGLFAGSAGTVLEGSFAYQENREYIKFAVFYYGSVIMPDSPGRQDWDVFCIELGCYSAELPEIKQLRTNLPILLVRCVGGESEIDLADIDYFIQLATEQKVPLTLIRFDEGSHAFDLKVNSFGDVKTKGIEIVKQTIEFMKSNAFAP